MEERTVQIKLGNARVVVSSTNPDDTLHEIYNCASGLFAEKFGEEQNVIVENSMM